MATDGLIDELAPALGQLDLLAAPIRGVGAALDANGRPSTIGSSPIPTFRSPT